MNSRSISATFIFLFFAITAFAQIPKVSSGSIQRLENFPSKYVRARNIDVWLPDNYDQHKKYPVLYMNDGGTLFDSSIVWNHQEWGVDDVFGKLIADNKIRECIVVGVWNTGIYRHCEFMPQKAFSYLSKDQQQYILKCRRVNGQLIYGEEKVYSDDYLRYIVNEVKPYIDSNFSTLPDKNNTFIAGSSMGGLISLYAICEYPEVFSKAACLSTHWTGIFTNINNPIPAVILQYLKEHLPDPATHSIYFDYGTATVDSLYKNHQLLVNQLMKTKGYTSKNWVTNEFAGAEHSENAWNKRLHIPAEFLLGRKK